MPTLLQDFRYALRTLLKNPGFTLVAVLTLALGIGANTAIFSIINAVLLRPLPYEKPGQLVRLYETEAAPGNYPFTGPDFLDWKTQNHTFQDMTLLSWTRSMNLSGRGEPTHVLGTPTEANFFALLGARATLGRTWVDDEDEPGHDREVILSYGLWQSHFASEARILGTDIALNGEKYNVVGVMPAAFHFPPRAQLWVPQDMDAKSLGHRGNHSFTAIGRLKPGATLQQAQAEMTVIAARLEKQFPDSNYKIGASLVDLHEDLVGESRTSLLMMLWAVALVLLIACANIANLLLSRGVARQREMAIRGALGARRGRLVRQVLTESVLLAGGGALAGLLLASVSVSVITSLKNLGLPAANVIEINPAVLAFAMTLAFLTGILFGIAPALQNSRLDFYEDLKSGAGSLTPGRRRRGASDVLVVAEIGVSLVLLVSAGLLLKDFLRLRSRNIGVHPQGVWTAALSLPDANYKEDEQQFHFSQTFLQKLKNIPGVESAALTTALPLEGGSNGYVTIRGKPSPPMSGPLVETHPISTEYFKVMGIPLLRGRTFTLDDIDSVFTLGQRFSQLEKTHAELTSAQKNAISTPVIVNHEMVQEFWPDQNPIGQMFSYGDKDGPWLQVIGVVGDVNQWSITHAPVPEAYFPFDGSQFFCLTVHTTAPSLTITSGVRQALAQIDPALPLYSIRTMDDVIAEHTSGQQFLALLLTLFSGLALLLAAIGIYGVLSYVVTQRTREIGIRISLGATRANVLALVLKRGMRVAGIGFAVGLAGALISGRLLSSLLHEVRPSDPAIILLTTLGLAMIAFAACYVPARRAAKVDPLVALRYE